MSPVSQTHITPVNRASVSYHRCSGVSPVSPPYHWYKTAESTVEKCHVLIVYQRCVCPCHCRGIPVSASSGSYGGRVPSPAAFFKNVQKYVSSIPASYFRLYCYHCCFSFSFSLVPSTVIVFCCCRRCFHLYQGTSGTPLFIIIIIFILFVIFSMVIRLVTVFPQYSHLNLFLKVLLFII